MCPSRCVCVPVHAGFVVLAEVQVAVLRSLTESGSCRGEGLSRPKTDLGLGWGSPRRQEMGEGRLGDRDVGLSWCCQRALAALHVLLKVHWIVLWVCAYWCRQCPTATL